MVILHIANVTDDRAAGVSCIVPQYVYYQSLQAECAMYNVFNGTFCYKGKNIHFVFHLSKLPEPFSHPDIAVFHEVYYPAYLRVSRELQQAGIPYIVIPHGSLTAFAQQHKRLKKAAANFLLFGRFLRAASAVQFLSQREEEASSSFSVPSFVIPNGTVIPGRHKRHFSASGYRFLYIGRISLHIKGLDLLLEAVCRTQELFRSTGSVLELYGPDEEHSYEWIKKTIDSHFLGDIVTLNQGVFGRDKENVLLNADCFVQTSRSEGHPLGVIEAMSYGLPCLVSEGTGMSRQISEHDAGWSCECKVASICKSLESIFEVGDKLSKKGASAREFVRKNYEWNKVVSDTFAVYRSIIDKEREKCFGSNEDAES